ncbi:MAG: MATE family efflux transporter, partial [Candidatus Latescibacteria bacterium]|nr:MATE family efflux transporter [Candidatus Latescibacterota bacterium]
PLVLTGYVLVGFFRGTANAMAPMWMTVVVNVVNVVGDYVLIYGKLGAPELGVLGAAWASVLAGLAGLIYALGVLVLRYRPYLAERPQSLLRGPKLRLLLATNANLFGRTASLLFAQFFMLSTVARMGEVALAANAVMMQIWSLASYTVDGFAFAAETLVGNCLGRKDFAEARRVARRCILWGVTLGIGYAVGYAAAIDLIVNGFTDHVPVRQTAASLIFWVAAIQPLNAVVFILDGIFIGANDTGYLFKAMALSAFGIYLPATLFLVYCLGLDLKGAWMGYNCLMIGRFATLAPRYAGNRWMRTFVEDGFA